MGAAGRIVGVLEDEHSSVGLLKSRPEVRYCFVEDGAAPPDEIFESDALLVWNVRSRFLRDNWSQLHHLRWVHATTAGVDRVLFPDLIDSDVVLTNSRGVFDRALAEYVIGLMLMLSKDFETTFVHQSEHRWVQRETETLHRKVVVVVGVGPIGRATARLAKAFGMTVRGIGRTARTGDPDFGDIAGPESLCDLFAEADYAVLILPKTPETVGMIDEAALEALKPTARVINVGRAATLDQNALVRSLREGRIAGAALDVMSPEPLPSDDPLWDVPHLLISPHMSGDHRGWKDDTVALFESNLDRWLRGAPLLNIVDKQLGYAPGTEGK
ncbi:MAG: D-2-hydroxyacid dehydrogenase [Candidatus Dormiibacterota bacterium]